MPAVSYFLLAIFMTCNTVSIAKGRDGRLGKQCTGSRQYLDTVKSFKDMSYKEIRQAWGVLLNSETACKI